MHDLFEYLYWRGDISFTVLGMADADHAVFCSLSYIPFDGILDNCSLTRRSTRTGAEDQERQSGTDLNMAGQEDGFSDFMELDTAAGKVLSMNGNSGNGPRFHLEEDPGLLKSVMNTKRFGKIRVGCYVNIFNPEMQEQFCAMTFLLPGGDMVVAFRGTDGTIIGWKEDFNMGFMDELPSQKDAVRYLNLMAPRCKGRLYVCGHSKGGNLAMYGASFANKAVQDKIVAVRSLDGPGFKKQITDKRGFCRMLERMETIMPQSSIVGVLLEHREKTKVIHSFAKGSKQHILYSWSISGGEFTEEKGLSGSSIRANKAINCWIENMSDEDRMKLTDGIFKLLERTDVETLDELFEAKKLFVHMKKIGKMDKKTKELIIETGRIMMNSGKRNR
ncbi:MAG: DUF2974 domain-containing protein [Lachnospiraceae bacterium]|nr:DUF2974 domain-containing protein [Lachnospiraceae bacterium]